VRGFSVRPVLLRAVIPRGCGSPAMTTPVRGRPFVSRAVRAARRSASLRVTIPQVVASTLGLRAGDELEWFIDPHSGEVRVHGRPQPATGETAEPTEPATAGSD
jgi:antidote-toxin recognition MazE-like antitoxin